jgi:hypothetical protein
LGIAATGPNTTSEIQAFTDATPGGGAGGFTITLYTAANGTPISTALAGATITFTTTPTAGQTAMTWNVVCVPTGAAQPMLNKAFGCP